MYQVAKAIITVDDPHATHYVMSIKRDPGSRSQGKLEFLGGRFEPNELPRQALLRELSEEESTGKLAELAAERANLFFPLTAGGARHFLFPFFVSATEYDSLCHHPDESFGYRLVHETDLKPCRVNLTYKTNHILKSMLAVPAPAL